MTTRLEPASFAKAIVLEAADIPAHMTIAQWREHKRAEQRTRRLPLAGRRWGRRARTR
jgi:hypothetical protein